LTELPRGTVTFLFTDIEGSTRLLKQLGERYTEVLADHRRILREAAEAREGREIDTQGDSFFFAFARANAALGAAVVAQRALAEHDWPEGGEVRVRMGLHTGEPTVGEESYIGLGVHRAARIGAVAHGGQVLLSNATRELVEDEVGGVSIRELGSYQLKDIDRPEPLFQLDIEGLQTEFPPLKAEKIAEPRQVRRRTVLVGALAGVIAAAVAIPIFALSRGSGGSLAPATVDANSIGVIDPETNGVIADVPIAGSPTRLAVGGKTVWVGNDDSGTVSGLDQRTHAPTKLVTTQGFPSDLAVGEGAIWAIDGRSGVLRKIDPVYGRIAGKARIAATNPAYDVGREGFDPMSVAAGLGSVWVTDGSRTLTRVDPEATKVVGRIDLRVPLDGVAVGSGAVWAISGASASVIRLDRRGRATVRIPIVSKPGLESPYPLQVEVGEGFVWVINGNTATLTKIDPQERSVSATIPVGIDHGPVRLAVGAGAAWVANRDGTLSRIDANTNTVSTFAVGHRAKDIAVARNAVWVTTGSGLSSSATGSANAEERVQALPTSSCSPIYYEGSVVPQLLIASDLPLQGTGTLVPQLSQTVQYVLRQHGFRAGHYAVGYQSCDDSIASSSSASEAKCAANAHAYARTKSVIGLIGPFTSLCSQAEIPIVNRASGGPLAMVNFSNTYEGITRAGPGTARGEPGRYYPSGVRNYVRVVAADSVQGAADAILAEQLGARRIYVLWFPIPYGRGISTAFESTAAKLGLRIVGRKPVDVSASYKALAAHIKQADPDAVFIAGFLDPSVVALIKNLRAGLGPSVSLMGPDGYSDFAQLVKLEGPAAEGMTVSVVGVPNDRLPLAGRKFVAAFGREVGEAPGPNAAPAAQATEVLLDAIARSDGTRASVIEQLFKTKVKNGILGSFSIDRNGDTTAGAVTIYRIVHGKPTVFRVITPPPALVR